MQKTIDQLPNNQIDVWKIEIPRYLPTEKYFFSLLNSEEKERAVRFISETLTSRYTIAQGAMRLILSYYLQIKPRDVSYRFGPYKKPYLKEGLSNLQFNLTHSQDLALVAISRDDEVGIDLEKINPQTLEKNLVNAFLTVNELATFHTLSKEKQLEAFFSAWTHKEALLKLLGVGLYKEMRELEVPLVPTPTPHTVDAGGKRMYITSCYVTDEYLTAIASYKQDFIVRLLSLAELQSEEELLPPLA